jgi:hypothetical protein
MLREGLGLLSMLVAAIVGATAVILAASTIFGWGGVTTRRGTHFDANWTDTGALALTALVLFILARLLLKSRKSPPTGD